MSWASDSLAEGLSRTAPQCVSRRDARQSPPRTRIRPSAQLTILALLTSGFVSGCATFGGDATIVQERDVLGVPLRIEVRDSDTDRAENATTAAFEQARGIAKQLLASRRTSSFGILNSLPPDQSIGVTAETKTIIQRALRVAKITNGAYTPTRNVLLKFWGVSDNQPRVPTEKEIANGILHATWNRLELDKDKSRILRRGFYSKIDLEGVSIGGIVEAAARTLKEQGVPAAHVRSGSISSVYTDEGGEPWSLDVMSLDESGQPRVLAQVDVREGGFASVFPTKLFVLEDGTRIHELIDPRSGHPVNNVNAAAVRTDDAATAAGLAWGAFVLGDRAAAILIKRPGVSWLIDTHEYGRTHTPDLAPRWLVEESPSGS